MPPSCVHPVANGFDIVSAATATDHERAIINAAYNWTRITTLDQGDTLSDQQYDGKTVILIQDGHVTLSRKKKNGRAAWDGRVKVLRLGANPGNKPVQRRQQTVKKDGLFDVTASEPGGCTFVEGFVCLSPAIAVKMLEEGHIAWYDEGGERVNSDRVITLLKDTTIKSERVRVAGQKGMVMQHTITVPQNDQLAGQVQQWFQDEWADYEKKRTDAIKIVTRHLYRGADNGRRASLVSLRSPE